MKRVLSLGYSSCPNDTYIFYALAHGHVATGGLRFADPVLADVEQLNEWALLERLDVTKLSFHALGHVLDNYVLLAAGAALGRGCGPLLVSHDKGFSPGPGRRVAIPGRWTTAALLLALYADRGYEPVVIRFDRIMDALDAGKVDAGVIIHEGRFTYGQRGLFCIRDLGQWWEESTGLPIPLGCIAAHKRLGMETVEAVSQLIRDSLHWIRNHPEQGYQYIRQHAQELEETVIESHIRLYVNDFSEDIGSAGLRAVQELLRRGQEREIFPKTGELTWTGVAI